MKILQFPSVGTQSSDNRGAAPIDDQDAGGADEPLPIAWTQYRDAEIEDLMEYLQDRVQEVLAARTRTMLTSVATGVDRPRLSLIKG